MSERNTISSQVELINKRICTYLQEGKRVFVSSSFQTHSIPLLHIIGSVTNKIPVYFLETGFHFAESLQFRDEIGALLDLDIRNVYSPITKIHQKDHNGRFYFCSNSDYCCHINKVLPLEPILRENDVWISGVRADQSIRRSQMDEVMEGPYETQRYHPMLQWSSKMIWEYRQLYALPPHPLEPEGYLSVGCAPCTVSAFQQDREGRWAGQSKEECGLHIDLVNK